MDVIEVIGLEIQAKPAGQAVDVVPPGGIPDQKDFSTLAGELLHHARFPAGIGLPGQDYQKGISSPERLLSREAPLLPAGVWKLPNTLFDNLGRRFW